MWESNTADSEYVVSFPNIYVEIRSDVEDEAAVRTRTYVNLRGHLGETVIQ